MYSRINNNGKEIVGNAPKDSNHLDNFYENMSTGTLDNNHVKYSRRGTRTKIKFEGKLNGYTGIEENATHYLSDPRDMSTGIKPHNFKNRGNTFIFDTSRGNIKAVTVYGYSYSYEHLFYGSTVSKISTYNFLPLQSLYYAD